MEQNKDIITPKMRGEYINNYCVIKTRPCDWDKNKEWLQLYSKDTDCYLTANTSLQELENEKSILDILIREGINHVESIYDGGVARYGFSERQNMWFGWSHRAYYGFTIGSEVKKGSIAFNASNKEDFVEDMLHFFCGYGEGIDNPHIENRTDKSFDIVGIYSTDPKKIPNKRLRGKMYIHHVNYPQEFGRGEWIAKTMEDAKEMAIDFARNIG